MNLTKRELAEVLVRFSGVVCGFFAIMKFVGFVGAAVALCLLLPYAIDNPAGIISAATAIYPIISFIVWAFLTFYLLRRGERLINFLSQESDSEQDIEPGRKGSLNSDISD